MTTAPIGDMVHNTLRHPYKKITNENETSGENWVPAPAPTTNPWTQNRTNDNITRTEEQSGTPNILNNKTPLTTYYDCLRMSLLFEDWYESFLMLQPLLGLPKWEMPLLLRQNMKGPKEMHPRNVREEAQKHQDNIQHQKQQQWIEEQRARQQNKGRYNRPNEQNENQSSTSQARPLTGANREPLQRRPTLAEKQTGPNPDPNQKKPLLPTPKDVYTADYSQTQPAPSTSTRRPKTNLSATQPIMSQIERPAPKPAVKDTVRCFENLSANESMNSSRMEHSKEISSSPEIQFSLGTYTGKDQRIPKCRPSRRESFKHITPNEVSDSDSNAEVEIEDEEDTLPDLQAPKETSRRVLRSNSRNST